MTTSEMMHNIGNKMRYIADHNNISIEFTKFGILLHGHFYDRFGEPMTLDKAYSYNLLDHFSFDYILDRFKEEVSVSEWTGRCWDRLPNQSYQPELKEIKNNMIKLEYEPYCEECEYFNPDKEVLRVQGFYKDTTDVIISCKEAKKCARMYRILETRNGKNKNAMSKVVETLNKEQINDPTKETKTGEFPKKIMTMDKAKQILDGLQEEEND